MAAAAITTTGTDVRQRQQAMLDQSRAKQEAMVDAKSEAEKVAMPRMAVDSTGTMDPGETRPPRMAMQARSAQAETETQEPERPRTEIQGGDIPTTEDEWKSKAEWEEFTRRQETQTGLRDIAVTRRQAELDEARAKVFDRRQEITSGYSDAALEEAGLATQRAALTATRADEAVRVAGVEAGLVESRAELDAADQRRAAEIATLNIEALEAEVVARKAEAEGIGEQTAAAVEQRQAQIDQVTLEAGHAIQDADLASQRKVAEAAVMAQARGAGGGLTELQRQDVQAERQRQAGRIGAKRDVVQRRLRAGIKEVESRADVALKKAEARVVGAIKAKGVQAARRDGARERQKAIVEEAATRAQEIRTAGKHEKEALTIEAGAHRVAAEKMTLQAAELEASAAGVGLDAQALRDSAEFGRQAADQGLDALINRPPIPDWNAIGRKVEAQQRWNRASGALGFATRVLDAIF